MIAFDLDAYVITHDGNQYVIEQLPPARYTPGGGAAIYLSRDGVLKEGWRCKDDKCVLWSDDLVAFAGRVVRDCQVCTNNHNCWSQYQLRIEGDLVRFSRRKKQSGLKSLDGYDDWSFFDTDRNVYRSARWLAFCEGGYHDSSQSSMAEYLRLFCAGARHLSWGAGSLTVVDRQAFSVKQYSFDVDCQRACIAEDGLTAALYHNEDEKVYIVDL